MLPATFQTLIDGLNEIKIQSLFDSKLTLSVFQVTKTNYLLIKISDEISQYCKDSLTKLGWIHDPEKDTWYLSLD